ncbi:MAG: NnrS family protein [Lautropia sp.]|nr:NnrS family protein [Lautropia sp.]
MLTSLPWRTIGRADHPLWLCPFRPFFALSLLAVPTLMLLWLAFLGAGWPLPAVPGGPLLWHGHELILGVGLAAVAGFVLTAVPEFTETPGFSRQAARQLVAWWLLGRVGFWLSGWWPITGMLGAGLAHLMLMGQLIWLVAPRLWRHAGRRQVGFLWGLVALVGTIMGFYGSLCLWAGEPIRWLHAVLGVLLILIIVSMSRISMAIVNDSIDEQRQARGPWGASPSAAEGDTDAPSAYLARPPRRHMAVFCISLFTLADLIDPANRITGWLALAASAAMLNLLNDWHVGRALWRRWPLMLYLVYGLMALGYGVIGLSILSESALVNAGLHLLTAGALGLAIFVVITIAGYTHSGLKKDGRAWVLVGACLLVTGALLRAWSVYSPEPMWLTVAGLLWAAAFGLQAWQMLPVFLSPRPDGGGGCEGIIDQPTDSATGR